MTGPDIDKLTQALEQAAASFNRLVLLAGPGESGKTSLLRQVSELRECPVVNVNLMLSLSLLELPRSKRPRQGNRIFGELIDECDGDLIVLDDLEVLFDTALQLDPLQLLKLHSRNKTLMASWNGKFQDGVLSYAEPDHPEYKSYRDVDVVVMPVAKETTASH
jgi:hypothetical protein